MAGLAAGAAVEVVAPGAAEVEATGLQDNNQDQHHQPLKGRAALQCDSRLSSLS